MDDKPTFDPAHPTASFVTTLVLLIEAAVGVGVAAIVIYLGWVFLHK